MRQNSAGHNTKTSSLHLPCLAVGLVIMVAGTLYPAIMTDRLGHPDHRLASALLWAMSAGFVRGLGFIPSHAVWRWSFSGWATLLSLAIAVGLRLWP